MASGDSPLPEAAVPEVEVHLRRLESGAVEITNTWRLGDQSTSSRCLVTGSYRLSIPDGARHLFVETCSPEFPARMPMTGNPIVEPAAMT